jgi:hypothetical protein
MVDQSVSHPRLVIGLALTQPVLILLLVNGEWEGGSMEATCHYSDQYKKIVKEARASFDNVSSITKTIKGVIENPDGDVPKVSYITTYMNS